MREIWIFLLLSMMLLLSCIEANPFSRFMEGRKKSTPSVSTAPGQCSANEPSSCDFEDIDREITLLETMIALQTKQIEALKAKRKIAAGAKRSGSSSPAVSSRSQLSVPNTFDKTSVSEPLVKGAVLTHYLTENFHINVSVNFIDATIMSFRAREYSISSGVSRRSMKFYMQQFIVAVDSAGKLYMFLADSGVEVLSGLNLQHQGRVTSLGYEGMDINYPTITTGADDGSIHTFSLEVWQGNKLLIGMTRPAPSQNESDASFIHDGSSGGQSEGVTAIALIAHKFYLPIHSDDSPLLNTGVKQFAYPTFIVAKARAMSSLREPQLLIGDSIGVLHRFNTSGYERNRLLLSTHRAPLSSSVSPTLGQYVAIVSGAEVHLVIASRILKKQATCTTTAPVVGTAFDPLTPRFLYVATATGAVLKYDTKARGDRKGVEVCNLIAVLMEATGMAIEANAHGMRNSLLTLGGYLIQARGDGDSKAGNMNTCSITAFNISARAPSVMLGTKVMGETAGPCLVAATSHLAQRLSGQSQRHAPPGPITYILTALHVPQKDRRALPAVRLIMLQSMLPAIIRSDSHPFGNYAWLFNLLKGPALIGIAIVFVFAKFGAKRRARPKNARELARRLNDRPSTIRSVRSSTQVDDNDSDSSKSTTGNVSNVVKIDYSSSAAKAPAGTLSQTSTPPSTLERLYVETQRIQRENEMCPRDLDSHNEE